MKPGYKTSEFWITLVALSVPILVHTGVLTTEQGTNITNTATSFVNELFDLIGVVVPAAYVLGRSYLKKNV